MGWGLLAGLGSGLEQAGKSLFAYELDKAKEERLQAIRERERQESRNWAKEDRKVADAHELKMWSEKANLTREESQAARGHDVNMAGINHQNTVTLAGIKQDDAIELLNIGNVHDLEQIDRKAAHNKAMQLYTYFGDLVDKLKVETLNSEDTSATSASLLGLQGKINEDLGVEKQQLPPSLKTEIEQHLKAKPDERDQLLEELRQRFPGYDLSMY